MPKHLTFADIPVRSLFVTGPTERIFIKLDNEGASFSGTLPNGAGMGGIAPGGNALDIACEGRAVWTPSNRIVSRPTRKHFMAAAKEYQWEQIRKVATEANQTRY